MEGAESWRPVSPRSRAWRETGGKTKEEGRGAVSSHRKATTTASGEEETRHVGRTSASPFSHLCSPTFRIPLPTTFLPPSLPTSRLRTSRSPSPSLVAPASSLRRPWRARGEEEWVEGARREVRRREWRVLSRVRLALWEGVAGKEETVEKRRGTGERGGKGQQREEESKTEGDLN